MNRKMTAAHAKAKKDLQNTLEELSKIKKHNSNLLEKNSSLQLDLHNQQIRCSEKINQQTINYKEVIDSLRKTVEDLQNNLKIEREINNKFKREFKRNQKLIAYLLDGMNYEF